MSTSKKLCLVSSSGGHWEELLCLSELTAEYDSVLITERGEQFFGKEMPNTYYVSQINRKEKGFLLHFIKLFAKAFKILKKERPDVVITTGALVAFPFCVLAKLSRKKVIYIESFARVKEKSLTGKLVYPFADLFIVQWESMLKCYPKAKYTGAIF